MRSAPQWTAARSLKNLPTALKKSLEALENDVEASTLGHFVSSLRAAPTPSRGGRRRERSRLPRRRRRHARRLTVRVLRRGPRRVRRRLGLVVVLVDPLRRRRRNRGRPRRRGRPHPRRRRRRRSHSRAARYGNRAGAPASRRSRSSISSNSVTVDIGFLSGIAAPRGPVLDGMRFGAPNVTLMRACRTMTHQATRSRRARHRRASSA